MAYTLFKTTLNNEPVNVLPVIFSLKNSTLNSSIPDTRYDLIAFTFPGSEHPFTVPSFRVSFIIEESFSPSVNNRGHFSGNMYNFGPPTIEQCFQFSRTNTESFEHFDFVKSNFFFRNNIFQRSFTFTFNSIARSKAILPL